MKKRMEEMGITRSLSGRLLVLVCKLEEMNQFGNRTCPAGSGEAETRFVVFVGRQASEELIVTLLILDVRSCRSSM